MEILNSEQYINEKLNIQPISKDRLNGAEPYIDAKTKAFIKEHSLVWNKLTMRYDCDGKIDLTEKGLTKFPVRFGKIKGDFKCCGNKLTSLDGAPTEVEGTFDCRYNEITSLEGAPQKVHIFYCGYNRLKTLEGAPQEVKFDFWCDNNKLVSLKGVPQKIGGHFYCNNNELKSLEYAPKEISCILLSNRHFDCSHNEIESLVGVPKCDELICSFNKLKNLEGSPRMVKYKLECGHNELESFEGAPEYVGDLYCAKNPNLNPPREKPSWVNGKYIIYGK
jgi:hypothetical protein